jgi:septal ring factor EnvC (AmiA/AmiB activator)
MNAQTASETVALDVASRVVEADAESADLLSEVRALALPKRTELTAVVADAHQRVALFPIIESAEDMELAFLECQDIKRLWQKFDEQRKSYTGPLRAAVKAIDDWYKPVLTALQGGETTLKTLMGNWNQHQEQLVLQARREAAAREAAERERLAAEQRALQAERDEQRRRDEEEEHQRRERAQAATNALLEQAAEALAAGDAQAAERVRREAEEADRRAQEDADRAREQAAARDADASARASALALSSQVITAAVALPVVHRPSGVSARSQTEAQVTDLLALVQFIAQHPERPELIALVKVDEARLKAYCKGMGEHVNLPGVTVVNKPPVIAVRTR